MKENNKLIAEFMGKEIYQHYHESNYHSSWNWLMPVVDKIEAEIEEEYRVVILEHECSIHKKTEDNKLQYVFQCVVERLETSKREATYNAVVEFIKHYNKNK